MIQKQNEKCIIHVSDLYRHAMCLGQRRPLSAVKTELFIDIVEQ